MDKKKIMLVASPGGHFVQLSLLAEYMRPHQLVIVGTYNDKPSFIEGDHYYRITDFSRDDLIKIFSLLRQCYSLLKSTKPDLVVTTGAAPGLVMVLMCKLMRKKAVWVDSVANSKKLSLSGRIARCLRVTVLSQWKKVASNDKVEYKGRVM